MKPAQKKTAQVTIKHAVLSDIPPVLTLWEEFMRDQRRVLRNADSSLWHDLDLRKQSKKCVETFFKKNLRTKKGIIVLAETQGKIIGFLVISIIPNIPIFTVQKLGEITDIYIQKPWRNQGISTQLKDEAVRWCKTQGITRLMLKVLPTNMHAHQVYTQWRFHPFLTEMRMNL